MDLIERFLEYLSGLFYSHPPMAPVPIPVKTEQPKRDPRPLPSGAPALLTLEQLGAIFPRLPLGKATEYLPVLLKAFAEFEINTPTRVAAFLAQVGDESDQMRVWEENLNYSAQALMKTWPKRFDEAKANEFAHQPEKIANTVYANRLGNGDEASGDGFRYRGRGLLQLTGKDAYREYGTGLGVDLVANPEKLLETDCSVRSACLYWKKHGLNALADAGNFREITHRINGGYIGEDIREKYWTKAKEVLGVK